MKWRPKPSRRSSTRCSNSPQSFDDALQPFQTELTDWMSNLSEAVAELEEKQAGRFSDSRQDRIDELQERLTARNRHWMRCEGGHKQVRRSVQTVGPRWELKEMKTRLTLRQLLAGGNIKREFRNRERYVMGRPPIHRRAMTNAERQRRYRVRKRLGRPRRLSGRRSSA